MSAKITVGLCAKNAESRIKIALMSINRQDYPHKLIKLIIIDDGSKDKTLSVIKNFVSKVDITTVILSSGGKGLGTSRQIVVDNAAGDYIVWVDDDLVLKKSFIRNQVEFMERNPSLGGASSNRIPSAQSLIGTLESISNLLKAPNPRTIGTGASIFRLKALKQIGGFDINIKGAGEDQDVSHRLKASGWGLSLNASSDFYQEKPATTARTMWNKHIWYGYGAHFLFHKYETREFQWERLWERCPLLALIIGFKLSRRIYPMTRKKSVFLLAPHYFLRSIPNYLGFIHAHLDGYGHHTDKNIGSNK